MKELSLEAKAKAYDRAIERANEFHFDGVKQCIIDTLEYIFPELAESKDEKIRKELIENFKWFCGDFPETTKWGKNDELLVKDIITWLEKQGEPVEINPTEFDTRLQALIGKFDSLPKEELIGSLSFWLNVVQNDGTYKPDEKQGEQKPVDKVESFDEFEGLTDFERTLADICIGWIGEELGWKQYIKDNADVLLKIAIEKFNSVQDASFEQKPAWSEEDKDMLENILGTYKTLEDMLDLSTEQDQDILTSMNFERDWLKSLKQRHTWKPSEEQIEALHDLNLTGDISYARQGQKLIELYNDLKKLTE